MEKINIYRSFLKINMFRKKNHISRIFSITKKFKKYGKMEKIHFFFQM